MVSSIKSYQILIAIILFLLSGSKSSTLLAQSTPNDFSNAIHLFKSGNYTKSGSILENLARDNPNNALIWFNLGHVYFMKGEFNAAIESYRKVVELKSKLSLPASLYAAKAYLRIGKLDIASDILLNLKTKHLLKNFKNEVEAEVKKLIKIYAKVGLNYYDNKNYEKAINVFDSCLKLQDDPELQMMKGLALLKSYKPREAIAVFKEIVRLEMEEEKIIYKNYAEIFLRQIAEDKWRGILPYWFNFSLRSGYNTNVYRNGISENLLSNALIDMSLNSGYQFYNSGPFSLGLSYNLKFEEIINQSSLRYIENSLAGILSYNKSISLALLPGLNYSILDANSFLLNPDISFITQKYFANNSIGMGYTYTRQIAVNDIFGYLSGNIHCASVFFEHTEKTFSLKPSFVFSKEGISDLELATGTLPLANVSFGPVIRNEISLSNSLLMTLEASFLSIYFDNVALPDNISREDKQFNFHAKLTKRINLFGIFIRFESVINRSTLGSASVDDKDYNQFIIHGGIELDIF